MSKNWEELTDDDLLNVTGSQSPEVIARYQRVMDKKTITALMEVRMGLFDVVKSMHVVTDRIEARLLESEKLQKESAASQSKLQLVTILLTVVIALATIVYTWITYESVQVQRESNNIQIKALEIRSKANVEKPSKNV